MRKSKGRNKCQPGEVVQSAAFFAIGFIIFELLASVSRMQVESSYYWRVFNQLANRTSDRLAVSSSLRHQVEVSFVDEPFDPSKGDGKTKDINFNVARLLDRSVRVMCLVLSTANYHAERARQVAETWGRRCTKLVFISDKYDPGLGTMDFSLGDNYNNWIHVWSKVRPAFEWAHREHLQDFDWFFKADDDTFAFMENMRFFLVHYDPDKPWFFGRHFYNNTWVDPQSFPHGGSGYILSRKALHQTVTISFPNRTKCYSAEEPVYEDVEMGHCVEAAGIPMTDTLDRIGRERFLYESPWAHLTKGYVKSSDPIISWDKFPYVDGEGCCSDIAMTFHYLPGEYQPTLEYLVYRLKVAGLDADFFLSNLP